MKRSALNLQNTVARKIGILAYGSLIGDPEWEIRQATTDITREIQTPFSVEFARSSSSREGAPTLVPVDSGGACVTAIIYGVETSEQLAADMLYRREVHRVGSDRGYQEPPQNRVNAVRIKRILSFAGYDVVLATRIAANIRSLTPKTLADMAISSAAKLGNGKDGISYLIAAKKHGIVTALSAAYEAEIIRRLEVGGLQEALTKVRLQADGMQL